MRDQVWPTHSAVFVRGGKSGDTNWGYKSVDEPSSPDPSAWRMVEVMSACSPPGSVDSELVMMHQM